MTEESAVEQEMDRLGTALASVRYSAGDTKLYAIACLSEAAYCLRALRAVGLAPPEAINSWLAEAREIVYSEPERVPQVLCGSDAEGTLQ